MSAATPARKRQDPRPRPVESGKGKTRLLNKDPERWYVLVATSPGYMVGEYESMGYRVETKEPGGVHLAIVSSKEGEVIQYQDSVLMSVDLKRKEEIDMLGADGESGWSLATQIESRIIDRRGAQADLMRGIHGARGYVGVQSNISPLMPDMGDAGPFMES